MKALSCIRSPGVALLAALAWHQPVDRIAAATPGASSDSRYVIVVDQTPAGQPYKSAANALAELRAPAVAVPLTGDGLGRVFERLKELKPAFVAFVVPPERIEDNFVGEVFERATRLNEDPELDFAYGFITGATPEDALTLVRNTARAEKEPATIPRRFVAVGHTFAENDLGPFAYQQALLYEQYGYRAWPINPIDGSVDWQTRVPWEMRQLDGASLIFFAGHGMGDSMCGIDATAFTGFALERAIVVSGPCHSAVTMLRHEVAPGTLGIKSVRLAPDRSICLKLIKAGAVAQLGSTASSCWGNVGPVVAGFFNQAKTVGEALRTRLNAHIRQNGISNVTILPFEEGKPLPQFLGDERNPAGIQSLARVVLIGDPAYRPFPQKQPVLPAPRVAERPHPMRAPGMPAASTEASVRPPPDLSRATVADLVAALNKGPSPDFAELNELIRRSPKAVPELVEALKTSDSWQVPKALGAIKDKRALDPLIEALARRSWSPYKEVTAEALELITGQKLGAEAKAWQSWRVKNQR